MPSQPNLTRVLVVDDDAMSRELLSLLLEQEGYAVQSADSGESALALIQRQSAPDLVLTDMQMPGTTGAQLAAQLRQACTASTVLLAISGSQPTADAIALFDGFLLKPFQVPDITAAFQAQREKRTKLTLEPATAASDSAAAKKRKRQLPKKIPPGGASSARLSRPKSAPLPAPSEERASKSSMNAQTETHFVPPSTIVSTEHKNIGPVLNETIYRQLAVTVPAAQLHEMYTMCVNDARRRIAGMRALVQTRDSARFVREAHAIKGGCGMLGATELHRMAAELETRGLKPGAGGAAQEVNSLDELSAACDRLERMLGSRV